MASDETPGLEYDADYLGEAMFFPLPGLKKFKTCRHAVTDWNKKGFAQGRKDIPLNDEGEAQAIAANPIVSRLDVKFKSSTLQRCSRTAELSTKGSGKEIVEDARLMERDFAEFEGTVPPKEMYRSKKMGGIEDSEIFSLRSLGALAECAEEPTLMFVSGGQTRVYAKRLGVKLEKVHVGNCVVLDWEMQDDSKWTITIDDEVATT